MSNLGNLLKSFVDGEYLDRVTYTDDIRYAVTYLDSMYRDKVCTKYFGNKQKQAIECYNTALQGGHKVAFYDNGFKIADPNTLPDDKVEIVNTPNFDMIYDLVHSEIEANSLQLRCRWFKLGYGVTKTELGQLYRYQGKDGLGNAVYRDLDGNFKPFSELTIDPNY